MRARSLLLALLCYAGLSAWFHLDLLRAPGSVLPEPVALHESLETVGRGDGMMVAATIGTVARRLLTAPGRVYDLGTCYPFSNALTLGEPMFVDALVSAVPFALTGNPIVAKNFVTVTAPVFAGLAMFALILYWTGSVPAALVAGLLFGFDPGRLADVSHPYVHGDVWAPLALLAAHRLFARRRWLDAALLAVVLTLQMLESFYPALALALVGGVYGVVLAAHHRRALPALLPKLLAIGFFVAGVGWLVFHPYLETREAWRILQGRGSMLLQPARFYFGGLSYLGTVLLVLAATALVDRARHGPTIVFDPRLPLLAAGALVYWFVVWHVSIPLVGTVASPYLLGLRELPVVNAVRAVTAVRIALPFVGSCLAGLGVAVLLRRRGPMAQRALGALLLAAAVGEIFFFPRSGGLFGLRLHATPAKPPASLLALLDTLPPGPVLDFPPSRYVLPTTHYVLLHGFHDRPTDACYSSFPSPLHEEVYTMAAYLPDSIAALRLRTLGFGSIVVHTEFLDAEQIAAFTRWADHDGRRFVGLRRIGEADGHLAYAFTPPPPTAGLDALAMPLVVPEPRAQTLDAPGKAVQFRLRNASRQFYRHPDPIRPQRIVLTWRDAQGIERASESVTTLLPIALTPEGTQRIEVVPATVPPPGSYTVMLRLHGTGGPVLAAKRVVIGG